MIRCHNLVDVFFAAKTLRNYKPNMVETLVRGRVSLSNRFQLPGPCQARSLCTHCPLCGSRNRAVGPDLVVPKQGSTFAPLSPQMGQGSCSPSCLPLPPFPSTKEGPGS